MQSIEEITAAVAAVLTTLAAVIAAAVRIKRGVETAITPEDVTVDKAIAVELAEIKTVITQLRADMEMKCAVSEIQMHHLEKDVATLFEKTDKLTDILIDHFSRQ